MKCHLVFYHLMICMALATFAQAQTTDKPVTVPPKKFHELTQSKDVVQLIDVRSDKEVAEGKLNGASQIDYNSKDFKNRISQLDKDTPVMVYCASGGRSRKTANLLVKMGFKEVYDLGGGIRKWKSEGYDVVKKKE